MPAAGNKPCSRTTFQAHWRSGWHYGRRPAAQPMSACTLPCGAFRRHCGSSTRPCSEPWVAAKGKRRRFVVHEHAIHTNPCRACTSDVVPVVAAFEKQLADLARLVAALSLKQRAAGDAGGSCNRFTAPV